MARPLRDSLWIGASGEHWRCADVARVMRPQSPTSPQPPAWRPRSWKVHAWRRTPSEPRRFRILCLQGRGGSSPPFRTNALAHIPPRRGSPESAPVSHPSRTRRGSIIRGLRRPRARQKAPGRTSAPPAPPITRPAATAFPCSSSKASLSARRKRRPFLGEWHSGGRRFDPDRLHQQANKELRALPGGPPKAARGRI